MYHSISDSSQGGLSPYYQVTTSPRRFAQQMDWLHEAGYRGMSLQDALNIPPCGSKPAVAITFDDGFEDFYTAAWPALRRHGFTATMYLPTGFIGPRRASFLGRPCLTWSEVRELRAAGIRFGSHTVHHPKLQVMPWEEIRSELADSKHTIEQELGEEISCFAHPYAFPQEDRAFTKGLGEELRAQGYRNCVTTMVGRVKAGDDPFALKRLPANSCDDHALFTAKLNGAYDWLGVAQRVVRQLKRFGGRAARRNLPAPRLSARPLIGSSEHA